MLRVRVGSRLSAVTSFMTVMWARPHKDSMWIHRLRGGNNGRGIGERRGDLATMAYEMHARIVATPDAYSAIQAYAGSIAMVAVSTLAGLWLAPRWGTGPVDMIYLPAVLAAAALWGIGPGVVAGFAAAGAYNFFFAEPLHTCRCTASPTLSRWSSC